MFGTTSSLLLKLQGVHGEWREEEESDQIDFNDFEPDPIALRKPRAALKDSGSFYSPPAQPLADLLGLKDDFEGCSICLESDPSALSRLSCGHEFCESCLVEYLRQKIRSREIERQRKSWLAPLPGSKVASAARLHVELSYGIPCPHFGCGSLIDVNEIRGLIDASTLEMYVGSDHFR